MGDPLARFSPAVRGWFRSAFAAPTQVQELTWEQIERGQDCLVIAPTGSGKTLAAFLSSIDRLTGRLAGDRQTPSGTPGVRVLYISPLKALGVDVERNLAVPLAGIAAMAVELGIELADVRVGVRSGDTSPSERRRLVAHPPEVLITTPESLFLILSSSAAAMLSTVETVIVDEVHCLAGTKRGAHLALSLERVDQLAASQPQRIGLSATVRPPQAVGRFLGGRDRTVTVVAPPTQKTWQLDVTVPVEDLTALGASAKSASQPVGSRVGNDRHMRRLTEPDPPPSAPSIWPHVEQQIFDLVTSHRSTICFCNSRTVAERLTNHLNDLYRQSTTDEQGVIARTHHGSISKTLRAEIEADLKAGRLPCVVATNSLELGIDMGAVDLVIQVGAPPSVASGLQRIGRGGHQVDAISHGVLFPLSRTDLLATAVVTQRMGAGQIETIHRIVNPLDVLAQHLVSMCLEAPQRPEDLLVQVRRADPFVDLPEAGFTAVVDMLTGKYPSDDFVELRPRLIWDRTTGLLSARPGARRLVTTSGGTIPDRGLYTVFMAGADTAGSGKRAVSRRVGELDEEMVYESRIGDIFTLGSSAWRITEINANQVIVTPVPGQTGRLPFWKGDSQSRSAEVGQAIQRFVSELGRGVESGDLSGVMPDDGDQAVALDRSAIDNLLAYIRDQRAATAELPDDRTIVVERHRDETGAWRVCIHCQLGRAVLQPWSMAIQRHLREALGHQRAQDVQTFITDDGITLRLGEVENPSIGALLAVDPDQITRIVAEETERSAMFAAHFRQCAARALLLPRRQGVRSPLWQQRLRSSKLLGVAAAYPDFPIMAEAARECLNDVFDLGALRQLMADIAARRVRIVEVETTKPSPFAASLLFGYTGAFMYEDDLPLAERIAASLVDPQLLASLLTGPSQPLDEAVAGEVESLLQRLAPSRHATTAEGLWDLLRELGPLSEAECRDRCEGEVRRWLDELTASGRVVRIAVAGQEMAAVSEDADLLADLPHDKSVRRLVRRWLRHHGIVRADQLAGRYGVGVDLVADYLLDLQAAGVVETVSLGTSDGYVDTEVLARIRQRTLTQARAKVKPVEQRRFASFLTRWQELDLPGSGLDAVVAAVEQLAGYPIPASMLDSLVLPARVRDYQPVMLDQLMSSGEVAWSGHGAIGETDGWICLWPGDMAPVTTPLAADDLTAAARTIHQRLVGGGAWVIDDLVDDDFSPHQVTAAIWELAWAGLVASDTLAPVRARSSGGGVLRRPHVPRTRRVGPVRPIRPTQPGFGGRWYAIESALGPTRVIQAVNLELDRYGILTRGSVLTEAMTPTFYEAYQVLAAMEPQGATRRGYFVADLGPAQFAVPGAVDRLREETSSAMLLLAACDPANPWGAGLAWPESLGHRPARKAGAMVVLDDGWPVVYLERGAHTLVTFTADPAPVTDALRLVGTWIDQGRIDTVTITKVNSESAFEARQWATALDEAQFVMTPSGFRRRPK